MHTELAYIHFSRKKILYGIWGMLALFIWQDHACGQNQWVKLNTPIQNLPIAPYFITKDAGFIFISFGTSELYSTTDGGTTWKNRSNDSLGNIFQLAFQSIEHGYLAGSNGVFETKDTGKHWKKITQNGNYYSIYVARNHLFAETRDECIASDDNGNTWTVVYRTGKKYPKGIGPYVCGNNDSIVFATNVDADGNLILLYTKDLGKTWSTNIMDTLYHSQTTEGLFCFSHCNKLLRTYLARSTDYYPIVSTEDFGATWKTELSNPEIGAWIAGTDCVQYVSNADLTKQQGLLRSTDHGSTWSYIPGPDFTEIDDADWRNIAVTGAGAIVYASDIRTGSLWKTTNGGDSTLFTDAFNSELQSSMKLSPFSGNTLVGTNCDTSSVKLFIQNLTCNYSHLDAISINGLNPKEYSIVRSSHYNCSAFSDTVVIEIFPRVPGTRNISISLRYIDDEFDTTNLNYTIPFHIADGLKPDLIIESPLLHTNLPGTLNFGLQSWCDAGGLDTIILSNPSCVQLLLYSAKFESDSLTQLEFTVTLIKEVLMDGSPYGKIIIIFHPLVPGVKKGNLVIETSNGTYTIPVSAIVGDPHGMLSFDSPKLHTNNPGIMNYDTLLICNSPVDTIFFFYSGCDTVTILDVLFEADSLTKTDFHFSMLTRMALDKSSKNGKMQILFKPLTTGMKKGNIIIVTSSGNDTIPISAFISADTNSVALHCDAFTSKLCDSSDGVLLIQNTSCTSIELDSISLSSPFHLPVTFSPFTIGSGDSARIPVRFVPLHIGSDSTKIIFSIALANGSHKIDTVLFVRGFAIPGFTAYTLSEKNILFPSIELCDSSRRRITLYSTGCDSLPFGGITISGDADFHILQQPPSKIGPGDSVVIDISLDPLSTGNKSATITLLLHDSETVVIPIAAVINMPHRFLSTSSDSVIDFGNRLTCETKDTMIRLFNPGCIPVTITGIGFQGSGFASAAQFPITLLPGHDTMIDIYIILDTAGGNTSHTSSMSCTSDADNTVAPITLTKNYIFPQAVHLWLDANRSPQLDGSVWVVKVKSIKSDLSVVNQIDFTLDYNSDLITYVPERSSIASGDGKTFQLSGNIIPASDSSIAQIAFEVYLAKDTATLINFSNIILQGKDTKVTGCEVVPLGSGTEFVFKDQCGNPSIRTILRDEPLQLGIRPNPARDEIELVLHSSLQQDTKVEIFDALGVNVFSDNEHLAAGINSIRIPTKNFAEGLYFIRIGGVSGSFVKVK